MSPLASSKTFTNMEVASLDSVEGDMSISKVQTRGLTHRRIEVNPAKSYAACSGVRYVLLSLPWRSMVGLLDGRESPSTTSMAMRRI
jgi:hypothetical protein